MTNHFLSRMTEATELTKAGKLSEATALLQSLLADKPANPSHLSEPGVIEGRFTRLDNAGHSDPDKSVPENAAEHPARRSLRETLRKISAGGMPALSRFTSVPQPVPAGAAFVTLHHRNTQYDRVYKLYIPANKPASNMPLVVMLHGCTQSPDDFAAGTGMNALAEQHGFLVAYPSQPSAANANKCWNWFKPEDQRRGSGEPSLIAGITRDILRDHPVDPAQVYVAGLSAGGAAAAILGATYPELFCAVGVHSGLAVGSATDIAQAFSAMRTGSSGKTLRDGVPTIVIHGTADTTVHPKNGDAVVAQTLGAFTGLSPSRRNGISAGGKSFRQTCYNDPAGRTLCEYWEIEGAGHAWAGGMPEGSFTDPAGPSASHEMVRFFLQHSKG